MQLSLCCLLKVSAMQNAAEKTGVQSTQIKEDSTKAKQELADLRDRLVQLNNEVSLRVQSLAT